MFEHRHQKITQDQINAVKAIMDAILNKDTKAFWKLLSSESKGYLMGSYAVGMEESINGHNYDADGFFKFVNVIVDAAEAAIPEEYKSSYIINSIVNVESLTKIGVQLTADHKSNVIFMTENKPFVIGLVLELEESPDFKGMLREEWKFDYLKTFKK